MKTGEKCFTAGQATSVNKYQAITPYRTKHKGTQGTQRLSFN